MLAAVILAAGKSERMGRPKPLLTCGGRTFLARILDSIREAELGPAFVVTGAAPEAVARAAGAARIVYNPAYEAGMTTSFQAGVRALPPAAAGAMFFLVDHPFVAARTIRRLAAAFRPAGVVIPTHQGRRGHPVLFAREILDEIGVLPADQGVNTVVRRRPERVSEIPVDDPGVLIDIDTPEMWARYRDEGDETPPEAAPPPRGDRA